MKPLSECTSGATVQIRNQPQQSREIWIGLPAHPGLDFGHLGLSPRLLSLRRWSRSPRLAQNEERHRRGPISWRRLNAFGSECSGKDKGTCLGLSFQLKAQVGLA